jgi:5-methylthioadenosine/S-adenosylhomocysteine deaminase
MTGSRQSPVVSRQLNRFIFLLFFLAASNLAGKEKVDLILSGGTIVTMDPARSVVDEGAIAVRGERILAVGTSGEIGKRYRARRVISARGMIILPGLINTHNHAPMTLFRGIADDMKLDVWLDKHIFPLESKNVTREFVKWGTALACLEMIRSGTTTYADMYYFEDQVAEVTASAGMRGVLGETIIQLPAPDSRTAAEGLAYAARFIERWKSHPLITPAVAPHAPYSTTADSLTASKRLADQHGVPAMIHVSETQDEEKQIRERQGMSATRWLESLDFLGPNVLFNHGVWLGEEDLAILRKHGVTVSHNPESNMKLASGTAPVSRMLSLGIAVGLGTDGAASNNNLDMFEVMDFAAKLHKLATMDPTVLPAAQVLEMATIGGAKALQLDREIGSLEKGKKADIILVDTGKAHLQPMFNVYSQLVYAAKGSDVRTSIINGKIVMVDRKVLTLNEAQILQKAKEYRNRIEVSIK